MSKMEASAAGMPILSNPDRRQRFIEAFSDALQQAVEQGDKKKLMFGVSDIIHLVGKKIHAIENDPHRFDIDGACMEATCKDLAISRTREAVVAFLTVGDAPPVAREMPPALISRIEKLCEGVADPELCLAVLRGDYPDWQIDLTPDGVDVQPLTPAL